jgi:enamine deaminase RidA (YjgF/YER057c/UK114 family)
MADLFHILPDPAKPGGNYSPTKIIGKVIHVSGQLPRENGVVVVRGHAGDDVDLEEAQFAARLCALHVVANLKAALGGFERLAGLGHVNVYVASTLGFSHQPQIADRASDTFHELLGEKGSHTRSALGVAELPRGATVEIDLVAYLT